MLKDFPLPLLVGKESGILRIFIIMQNNGKIGMILPSCGNAALPHGFSSLAR